MFELQEEDAKVIIPLFYIIPSYILYLCILYIIFVVKIKVTSQRYFYKLFGFSAICYIADSLTYYFDIRTSNAPIFLKFRNLWGQYQIILILFHTSLFYFAFATRLFNVALTFNRFTLFWLIEKYQGFWFRWLNKIIIACFILPILFVWHIPFTDLYMQAFNESDPEGFKYIKESERPVKISWMNNPRNYAILLSFTSILSFFMNLFIILQLFKSKYYSNPSNDRSDILGSINCITALDIKMSFYSIILLISEVTICVQEVVTLCCCPSFFNPINLQYAFLWPTTDDAIIEAIFNFQYYLYDITTLGPVWFIFVTSKSLRAQMFSAFCESSSAIAVVAPWHPRLFV